MQKKPKSQWQPGSGGSAPISELRHAGQGEGEHSQRGGLQRARETRWRRWWRWWRGRSKGPGGGGAGSCDQQTGGETQPSSLSTFTTSFEALTRPPAIQSLKPGISSSSTLSSFSTSSSSSPSPNYIFSPRPRPSWATTSSSLRQVEPSPPSHPPSQCRCPPRCPRRTRSWSSPPQCPRRTRSRPSTCWIVDASMIQENPPPKESWLFAQDLKNQCVLV